MCFDPPRPPGLLLLLLLCAATCCEGVGGEAAAPAGFPPAFTVGDGGGAELQGLASLQTTINGKSVFVSGASSSSGWRSLTVDRTAAKTSGGIVVRAVAARFTLERHYIAATNGRILVNDTFTCTFTSKCPLYTNHTTTFQQPTVVRLNGAFNGNLPPIYTHYYP